MQKKQKIRKKPKFAKNQNIQKVLKNKKCTKQKNRDK